MRPSSLAVVTAALLLAVSACSAPQPENLVVYSGRSKSLVEPLINAFSEKSGIQVEVRYGDTAQLAVALLEEGDQSGADLYWAQDAGALGAVQAEGLFASLPDTLVDQVAVPFRSGTGYWVGTSGRARTLAFAPSRVERETLPTSILALTAPEYRGRVGWAPTNGSFQAAMTAMRKITGDEATRAWLEGMMANDPQAYGNNRGILEGIANGEVDLGLPNHYYLYPYIDADPDYPVDQVFFADRDPGNLINVAGIGLLKSSDSRTSALAFVSFLLSDEGQQFFVETNYEYPVVAGAPVPDRLPGAPQLSDIPPALDLDDLGDLQATLELLREVGLL